jgi:aldose sugar dehydrogenase
MPGGHVSAVPEPSLPWCPIPPIHPSQFVMSRLAPFSFFPAFVLVSAVCSVQPVEPQNADPGTISPPPAEEVVLERVESEEEVFRLVRVTGGLERPWGMAFLPDGSIVVTERSGRMSVLQEGQLTQLEGLPEIRAAGQGGLLDVAVHPDYDANGWIYFTYSAGGEGGSGTALARARLDGARLVDLEVLYSMDRKTGAGAHFGSRILFLDDGTLLLTIGDRGAAERAQDPMDAAGSTIRLNDDGSIPADNPFVGQDGHLPELYTIGNRNSQGMDIHPQTRDVWQSEHGPRGGDELNLILPGRNYGWPEATWGRDYRTQEQIGVIPSEAPQFEDPVHHWTPAIAPSGTAFYSGDSFPNWRNDLFIGSLVQQKLVRVVLDGRQVTHEEDLLEGAIDRIRYVTQGPDGLIYLLNDRPAGGIYRIEPVEE